MAKHQYSEENQPKAEDRKPRGKGKRTLVLDALGRGGFSEEGFYDELVNKAMVEGDAIAFQELLKRFHPVPKSVAPYIEIEYPHNGTIPEKAAAIEKGIFSGDIPPDVGIGLIGALSNIANIDDVHDLRLRIEKLEEMLNKNG